MISFTGRRCARERARIVRLVAVLALELHEAADRQPVERVERLALRAEDLRPRREADPELEDADLGQLRAVTKWPSSWMSTSAPRIRMNRTIVMIDWSSSVMRPHRSGREGGADLEVEGDEALDVGRLVGSPAEAARRPPRAGAGCRGSRGSRRGSGRRRPRRPRSARPTRADPCGPPRARCAAPGTAPRRARGSRGAPTATRSGGVAGDGSRSG